jgi:hypothetical protein
MAMGKALYKEEDYEGALKYARLAKDLDGYSDAFWEIRNEWIKHHLTAVVLVLVALFLLRALVRMLDRKKQILKAPRAFFRKLGEKKLIRELRYLFYFMRHPIDGCYGIKREGKVSVLAANILLAIGLVFYIVNRYFCGFLFKTVREGRFDVLSDVGMVLIAAALLVGCNYLMCTINDGEGRMKDIYCAFVYSFGPYLVMQPFLFLLSHGVTYNEEFFVHFGTLVMFVWVAVLIVISVREINNYTVGETAKILFLTAFTVLIVCLLAFILYVLWAQVFDFVGSFVREVVYRIGS